MIIGTGMIASLFSKSVMCDEFLIHAAGVSDSGCVSRNHFERDASRLRQSLEKGRRIIYFSSQACADISNNSSYIRHKLEMEKIITNHSESHVILRIPQVASKTKNPNTLLNSFYNSILTTGKLKCYSNTTRNLIKDSHILNVTEYIISSNLKGIINFCSPYNYYPAEIVEVMSKVLDIEVDISMEVNRRPMNNFTLSNALGGVSNSMFLAKRDQYLYDVIEYAIAKK